VGRHRGHDRINFFLNLGLSFQKVYSSSWPKTKRCHFFYLHLWILDHVEESKEENGARGLAAGPEQVGEGPLKVGETVGAVKAGRFVERGVHLFQINVDKVLVDRRTRL